MTMAARSGGLPRAAATSGRFPIRAEERSWRPAPSRAAGAKASISRRRAAVHPLSCTRCRSGPAAARPACSFSPRSPARAKEHSRATGSASWQITSHSQSTTPGLYEREQNASRTLQLGLLGGELPQPPGTSLVAAYRPGTVTNEVGGDWYDAFTLDNGKLAILVGDVVGHDLEAAVAMGQLRGAVRALASLGTPGALLERLDSFVSRLRGGAMTTMAYAELDIASGELCYACAGHPPPLAISADGEPRYLWAAGRARWGSTCSRVPRITTASRAATRSCSTPTA